MLKLTFWNHATLVNACRLLADDLTPFLFRTDGGELTLEIKEDEIERGTMDWLNFVMANGHASLAGLSQLSA
jgi:hypothetical protein